MEDDSNSFHRSRTQAVFVRSADEVAAMAWDQRMRKRVFHFLGSSSKSNLCDNQQDPCERANIQWRLEAHHRKPKQTWRAWIMTCGGLLAGSSPNVGGELGVNPNQKLAMSFHWMFRVNFLFLFVVMCVLFFALVIIFAGFITVAGQIDPDCVRVGRAKFDAEDTAFADAFALSWTTFSTVGYGSTYPGLGYQNHSPTNCFFINFILGLESLVGVIYSGFCGAILFGKVLRIQSHAQVTFSDPLLIRYGRGVATIGGDVDQENEEHDDEFGAPCPVLEFRIVNRLHDELGGEIMDASLNVVANIDTNDAEPSFNVSSLGESLPPAAFLGRPDSESDDSWASDSKDTLNSSFHRFMENRVLGRHNHAVDEDLSPKHMRRHVFSKMDVMPSEHPFFKRVWLVRHVLDEKSPILKYVVRQKIQRNNGAWPDVLNKPEEIRRALHFNQILVSLTGISNVSASQVYAQKIYDFVDVSIGYQFVNLLYRNKDGNLGVDTDLINDVREQVGGGGEILMCE